MNGQNGTIDMRTQFVVGAATGVSQYELGDTGGGAYVWLTAAQSGVAAHTHSLSGVTASISANTTSQGTHGHIVRADDGGSSGPDYPKWGNAGTVKNLTGSVAGDGGHSHTVTGTATIGAGSNTAAATPQDASAPIDNRPNYVALGFVQRIPYGGGAGGPGGSATYPEPTF